MYFTLDNKTLLSFVSLLITILLHYGTLLGVYIGLIRVYFFPLYNGHLQLHIIFGFKHFFVIIYAFHV